MEVLTTEDTEKTECSAPLEGEDNEGRKNDDEKL